MDVEVTERVEAEIDQFIAKRAQEKDDANAIEAAWAESARRHNRRIREENRQGWLEFHQHMQALHNALAEEHRAKAQRLLEESRSS